MKVGRLMTTGIILAGSLVFGVGEAAPVERPLAMSDGSLRITGEKDFNLLSPRTQKAVPKGSGPAWNVVFTDVVTNTGFGFDDPVSGPTRQALLLAVLVDVGSMINSTHTIDVEVWPSTNTSDYWALGGTYYDSVNGVMDPDSYKAIVNGMDLFPTFPDLVVEVSFAHTYNETINSPASHEHDLYSKIKASVLRGMGILTLSTASGESTDINMMLTRSRWDSFLVNGSDISLFDSSTGAFNGTTAWLTGGSGGVFFNGTNSTTTFGGNIPVYAPDPFAANLSFISWADTEPTSTGVLSRYADPGIAHRTLADYELGALSDLGYSLNASNVEGWEKY